MIEKIQLSRGRSDGRQCLLHYLPSHIKRPCNAAIFSDMDTPLYFAYGSNLLKSRLQNRIGHVERLSTFLLYDYDLVFNVNECYANIERGTQGVEGVLYQVTDRQIAELDLYEGYPRIYQKRYFLANGKIAYLYLAEKPYCYTDKPKWFYFNYILEGCLENNLDKTYKRLLQIKKDMGIKRPRVR